MIAQDRPAGSPASSVLPEWEPVLIPPGAPIDEAVEAILRDRQNKARSPSQLIRAAAGEFSVRIPNHPGWEPSKLLQTFACDSAEIAERQKSGIALLLHRTLPQKALEAACGLLEKNEERNLLLTEIAASIPGKFGHQGLPAVSILTDGTRDEANRLPRTAEEEAAWSLGKIGFVGGVIPVLERLEFLQRNFRGPYCDYLSAQLGCALVAMAPDPQKPFKDQFAGLNAGARMYQSRLSWVRAMEKIAKAEHAPLLRIALAHEPEELLRKKLAELLDRFTGLQGRLPAIP